MPRQSVLIADGNRRLADVMAQLIADEPGFQLVGVAHDAPTALEHAERRQPDVILVSERIDEVEGVELCVALRPVAPDATLLVWSHDVPRTAARAPVVDGVLDRGMTFRELLKAISKVRRIRLDPRPTLSDLRL